MAHTLITIAYSHYNERARWALDLAGIAYDERPYVPPFNWVAVALASGLRGGRADRVSTRWSTPYLITEDGEHLGDSGAILRWAEPRIPGGLHPDDTVAPLEQRFHDRLGPHTRRLAYTFASRDGRLLPELARHTVPAWQAWGLVVATPLMMPIAKRSFGISDAGFQRSMAIIDEELDFVNGLLADGRPYLTGDRFTAADLTFAAMCTPAMLIGTDEGATSWFPPIDEAPEEAQPHVRRWRAMPAGAFALRMFREERARRDP